MSRWIPHPTRMDIMCDDDEPAAAALEISKPLTREELKAWLNRPCPPKSEWACEHPHERVGVWSTPSIGPTVYGCLDCGAEWWVP